MVGVQKTKNKKFVERTPRDFLASFDKTNLFHHKIYKLKFLCRKKIYRKMIDFAICSANIALTAHFLLTIFEKQHANGMEIKRASKKNFKFL